QAGHREFRAGGGDERARSLDSEDRAVADEQLEGGPDHRARDFELFLQLALRGKARAGLPGSKLQHSVQLRGELEVKRYPAAPVQLAPAAERNLRRLLGPAPKGLSWLGHLNAQDTFAF